LTDPLFFFLFLTIAHVRIVVIDFFLSSGPTIVTLRPGGNGMAAMAKKSTRKKASKKKAKKKSKKKASKKKASKKRKASRKKRK